MPETDPGVYIVAMTNDEDSPSPTLPAPPFSADALRKLLTVRTELTVDAKPATAEMLADRLAGYWMADEVVLYIGLSSRRLRKRVGEYRRTRLGAAKPHAGGWWLKTLDLTKPDGQHPRLWVHYAPTPDFVDAEKHMLAAFASAVSERSRARLHDRERAMPFANLRGGDDLVKRHGIEKATGALPPRT